MATTIDELQVLITAQTGNFSSQMHGVQSQLGSLESQTSKTGAALTKLGEATKVAFVAIGAAVATGLVAAVKSTASYESSLSQLKQASGATGEQMQKMSEITRKLGQDSDLAGVSAADVAEAMVELSKAGLSVNETMDATKGVLSLAKAGGIEFADAATIAASALNAFGLEGKDASKVADMLAAGANASQAELGDLAQGLQQSATVAKQFGLGMNETVSALALFANNGIKGSDAGTSLKTMLIALASPSKEAAGAMKEIGFQAYDAKGKFVGLEEMSSRLKKATEKLTDEQKQNTLATIFGTDAFRAASVLADNAGDSYLSMSKNVGKAGAAQEAAAAQMGPLQKSWERFSNTLSEFGLAVGLKLSPYVSKATDAVSDFVGTMSGGIGVVDSLGGILSDKLGGSFSSLYQTIQGQLVPALGSLWKNIISPLGVAVGGTLLTAFNTFLVVLNATVVVVSAVLTALSGLQGMVIPLTVAFVAYKAAIIATNTVMSLQSLYAIATGTNYMLLNGSLIAVETSTIAATVAQKALNVAMTLSPIGLVVAGAAAIVTAYIDVMNNTDATKNATDRYAEAKRQSAVASDEAKAAEERLRGSLRDQEGANLRVERSQRNYNDAVANFGPNSLEAREANYQLKDATEAAKEADKKAQDAVVERDKKLAESNRAKEVARTAELSLKNTIQATTDNAIRPQQSAIDILSGKLGSLNGRNFSYSVTGTYTSYEQKLQMTGTGAPLKPGFASGGFTGRGGKYDVAGVVHRGEYVLPQSAVDQSTGMPKMNVNAGSSQPQHIIVKIGEETIIEKVIKGINTASFMKNSTVIEL
jgi:TP901 family phage tail tape measure protein